MTTDGEKATAVPASITSIQNANWHGRIPIQLSIAPTSLSSPNKPRSIHRMVSRMTYLHLGLFDEIMHLYEYAPSSIMAGTGNGKKQMMVVREEPPDSPPKQEQQGNNESDDANNHNNKEEAAEQQQGENTSQSNQAESSYQNNDKNNDQRIEQSSSSTPTTTPPFPECWFEDEESGLPLRWQLFVGVLYDLMKGRLIANNAGSPCNQFRNLPWKIRIHFTLYPTDQLLPLDITVPPQQQHETGEAMSTTKNNNASQQAQINTLIGRMYRNSLKQALFLQYGSSKVAMSITKNNHEKMWDAVVQSNYDAYHQVNNDLQVGVMAAPINNKLSLTDDLTDTDEKHNKALPQLVPVRILLNDKPAIQKPTLPQKKTISEYLKQRPTEILQDDAVMYVSPYTTLGDVLVSCLPDLFKVDDDAPDCNAHYSIQGVKPSLTTTIVDLWRSLCHPDHFLYVIVATQ
eukprot:scaffold1380_cov80-Skeletonema_dohrnii-CCMP3373.AAC.2